ncbi:MFS transporter [Cellulomonas alba]|uniref:MFS transporter n=1 Tax=Cellulomonas alba TaxID=3053467 RepID=A0ABT7SE31_9CELL|nr:MFS transporter [Cellulomonas alba]MDM7854456.1 MFS transporter [Cellulomonas alba]
MRSATEPRPTRAAWVVWSAAVLVYFVAVTHRTALGVAGVEAVARFDLAATGLALFSVVQLTAYAAMQIPAGQLIDRLGPRAMLTGGAVLMATGQLVLATAHSVPVALVARVLIGAGDAPVFIGACRLVAEWFPPRSVPVMVQVTGLIGQSGQLASAIPVAWLLHHHGWTATFATLAGVGLATAVVGGVLLRSPARSADLGRREPFWHDVRLATTPSGVRLGFWSHFLTPFSANVVTMLWGVPFFVTAQRRSTAEASLLLTALTLTAMTTGPIIGRLTARHPLRRSWIVLGSATASLLAWVSVLAFDTPRPLWQLVLVVIVLGVGGPVSLVGMDYARTFSDAHRIGTASGFVNVGGFASTILSVLAIGVVLQVVSPPGTTTYSLDAFRVAFSVLLVPWVVGVLGVWRNRVRTRADLAATGVLVPPIRDVIRRRRHG